MVHLFEWAWTDVATECETFLGPKGFAAVQVSPPMEHIQGSQWWTRYQPVSYKFVSRSGDEAAFKEMVKRCNAVGVYVIIDAVINHMAAGSGTGVAGSTFGNRQFAAAAFGQNDFHHSPGNPSTNCAVNNYADKNNVQSCDLVGLSDLCTGCSYTKSRLVSYLKSALQLGSKVAFRIDAAKHQDAGELGAVIEEAGSPWAFTEVISGAGEAVTPAMYLGIGHVTEFNFARVLGQNIKDEGKLQYLESFGTSWGLMESAKAVTFLDNHDTQRGEALLTYKDGDLYNLANVFMLAADYGLPKVMSSYDFSDHDQGPPSYPVRCGSGWVCEHRRPTVANMVAWRKSAGESSIENFQKDGGNHIAFSRGGNAFVAMNRDGSRAWMATLKTGLPAGSYCNVIQSDQVASCPRVEVDSSGNAQVEVPAVGAVALHMGKRVVREFIV